MYIEYGFTSQISADLSLMLRTGSLRRVVLAIVDLPPLVLLPLLVKYPSFEAPPYFIPLSFNYYDQIIKNTGSLIVSVEVFCSVLAFEALVLRWS